MDQLEEALKDDIGTPIDIGNHGAVRLVDFMGSDERICDAARVSFLDTNTQIHTDEENERLIRYMMRNRHTSPFEHVIFTFHVKCPIFVARQWMRHRTWSYNEISGRYSEMQEEFFMPGVEDLNPQSRYNRQGRDPERFSEEDARVLQSLMGDVFRMAYLNYTGALRMNLARELARIVLPLSLYTEFYGTVDLHNLLHFIELRASPHAQKEIRDYAIAMGKIVAQVVPMTWRAFLDYRFYGVTLSQAEAEIVRRLRRESGWELDPSIPEEGFARSEWREFVEKLDSSG